MNRDLMHLSPRRQHWLRHEAQHKGNERNAAQQPLETLAGKFDHRL